MKPHEETWRVEGEYGQIETADGKGWVGWLNGGDTCELDYARARLAAQAPAMARKLLALQRADDGLCPDCLADFDEGCEDAAHKSGCELAKVLRDAGVLP